VGTIDLKGKLIVFEGIDFTGKSTQVELLADRLVQRGYDVVTTREPGGTAVGESVRQILLSRENSALLPLSELLLFIISRAQHTAEVIEPALKRGAVVLASRYRLSSLAYQGYGRGIDLGLIRRLNDVATGGRQPDVTFLIDLPAETALNRKRGKGDRIESETYSFYQRVRQGYLELMGNDPHIHRIDGTLSVVAIAETVANYLGI
jgi:dTMP kinase